MLDMIAFCNMTLRECSSVKARLSCLWLVNDTHEQRLSVSSRDGKYKEMV